MGLEGKVALVTGSSRGMGKRMALHLAKEGADIVVAARTQQLGESAYPGTVAQTVEEIEALGRRAVPVKVDLAVGEEVEAMCQTALDAFGRVDILVNNAFYTGPGHYDPFLETSIDQWNTIIAVDLTAPFIATRLLVPQMIEIGGGIIINTSSGAARNESPNLPGAGSNGLGYPTAKAGLERFVRALEKEVRRYNIAVSALDPGFTLTERAEVAVAQWGFDPAAAHSMDVPAKTALYLCTCPDPMWYSGKVVYAPDFVREHNLI